MKNRILKNFGVTVLCLAIMVGLVPCTGLTARATGGEDLETLSSQVSIGDYVSYTPESTGYAIPASMTGSGNDQTINPSELNLWRVIRVNDDGSVEIVSENVSSVTILFKDKTGYAKYVDSLNTIANQYKNDLFVSKARVMGYSNQVGQINSDIYYDRGDEGYVTDKDLVETALGTLIAKNPQGTAASYWIGSRLWLDYSYSQPNKYVWYGRIVATDGSIHKGKIVDWYNGAWTAYGESHAFRPILTLKSDVLVSSGDGTETSPYQLSVRSYNITKQGETGGTYNVSHQTAYAGTTVSIDNIIAVEGYEYESVKVVNDATGEELSLNETGTYKYSDDSQTIIDKYNNMVSCKETIERIEGYLENATGGYEVDMWNYYLERARENYNSAYNDFYNSYTDEDYNEAKAKRDDRSSYDYSYTFVMPVGDVTITTTFKCTIEPEYKVTVTNGTGSGDYEEGATVTVTANPATAGQTFKGWTGLSGLTITAGDANSNSVSFIMPATAVNVTAVFETKFEYKIIEGADGTYTLDKDESPVYREGSYTIRANGDFDKFVSVEVDGKVVDSKYYTAKSGSTIITFTAEFMKLISAGTHTIKVNFTDGSATTSLTIKQEAAPKSPATGDGAPIAWLFALIVVSGIGLVANRVKKIV